MDVTRSHDPYAPENHKLSEPGETHMLAGAKRPAKPKAKAAPTSGTKKGSEGEGS